MERRKFLKATAVGSTCMLAGAMIPNGAIASEQDADFICKITVLKKTLNKEWSQEYRNFEGNMCDRFSEGQEFVVESPWEVPEGFCPWAWADIRTFIHLVNSGQFQTFVSCCTD